MSSKLKDFIIKYFILQPRPPNQKLDSYKCKFCTQVYVFHTTRMRDHLLECKGCPAQIKCIVEERQISKQSQSKKSKLSLDANAAGDNEETNEVTPSRVLTNLNSSTQKQGNTTGKIKQFFDKMSKNDQEQSEILLAKAIFTGGIPFRFLENENFLKFLTFLRPTFEPPTRVMVAETLLDKVYDEVEKEVKKKINDARSLTIQCDSYTNVNNEGVMNFIINTPAPVYYKHVETKDESQSGEYLAKKISAVIQEIGPSKVMAVMTDNASYCKKAWDLIQKEYESDQIYGYGCAAHVLNLFCQDIVTEVSSKSIMENAVKIVKAIKQSNILSSALKDIQKTSTDEDKTLTTLKLPGKTRWGSSLMCLSSIFENRYNLKQLAISKHGDRIKTDVKDLLLNDIFWSQILKLIDLLKPVVTSLKKIESDKTLISNMVDMFANLEVHIKNQLFDTAPSVLTLSEAENILNKLIRRAENTLTPMHFAANILNPSARGKKLREENYSAGYDLISKLRIKFGNISQEKLLIELVQYTAETGFWSSESAKKTSNLVDEISWWSGVCGCTSLSKIAIPILSLPCSSAATERSFSTYGWIHNAKRNRLTVSRATKVCYVAHNLKLLDPERKFKRDETENEEYEDYEDVYEDKENNATSTRSEETLALCLSDFPPNIQEGTYIVQTDDAFLVFED